MFVASLHLLLFWTIAILTILLTHTSLSKQLRCPHSTPMEMLPQLPLLMRLIISTWTRNSRDQLLSARGDPIPLWIFALFPSNTLPCFLVPVGDENPLWLGQRICAWDLRDTSGDDARRAFERLWQTLDSPNHQKQTEAMFEA